MTIKIEARINHGIAAFFDLDINIDSTSQGTFVNEHALKTQVNSI